MNDFTSGQQGELDMSSDHTIKSQVEVSCSSDSSKSPSISCTVMSQTSDQPIDQAAKQPKAERKILGIVIMQQS